MVAMVDMVATVQAVMAAMAHSVIFWTIMDVPLAPEREQQAQPDIIHTTTTEPTVTIILIPLIHHTIRTQIRIQLGTALVLADGMA